MKAKGPPKRKDLQEGGEPTQSALMRCCKGALFGISTS